MSGIGWTARKRSSQNLFAMNILIKIIIIHRQLDLSSVYFLKKCENVKNLSNHKVERFLHFKHLNYTISRMQRRFVAQNINKCFPEWVVLQFIIRGTVYKLKNVKWVQKRINYSIHCRLFCPITKNLVSILKAICRESWNTI